ncbi:Uncharacterised protein [Mycobacteroides abscessus subsp. abscessus]|nr:Uncharacterised protein [Mycobacteroides abscessus subsp. abscessus]
MIGARALIPAALVRSAVLSGIQAGVVAVRIPLAEATFEALRTVADTVHAREE